MVVDCASCHNPSGDGMAFMIGTPTCVECHQGSTPHADQFAGRACESCHVGDSFDIEWFDHDETRYPLDGAHEGVECASCHATEVGSEGGETIRYRPLDTECRDCHGSDA